MIIKWFKAMIFMFIIIIIIIKVFIKHRILSIETILSAYTRACKHVCACTHTHAGAPEHTSILTIQNLIYTVEKMSSRERDLRWLKTAARNRKYGRPLVLGKEETT